jgi:chromosome segregation ATPase
VERLVRQALTETVRQSAHSAQLQVRQIEIASGELAAELRAQLHMAYEEGERCATQLDEVETALTAARTDIGELTSVAEARRQELHRLETEWRAQLGAAQSSVEQAYDARARAEEALHASDLARLAAVGDLELARQKVSRLEQEIERTAAANEKAERRAREAERELDVARGTLASITEERDALRRQIEGALMQKAAAAPSRPLRNRRSEKKISGAST